MIEPITAIQRDKKLQKIVKVMLDSPTGEAYFSDFEGRTGLPHRDILMGLAYLIDAKVLSYRYEAKGIGEHLRPGIIKWYRISDRYKNEISKMYKND